MISLTARVVATVEWGWSKKKLPRLESEDDLDDTAALMMSEYTCLSRYSISWLHCACIVSWSLKIPVLSNRGTLLWVLWDVW